MSIPVSQISFCCLSTSNCSGLSVMSVVDCARLDELELRDAELPYDDVMVPLPESLSLSVVG